MTVSPGAKIKELRTISGMSQEELGKRVGVQRAAINKYETGVVTNIPIATIEKLAEVFNVSPTYLLGWDNKSKQLAFEVNTLESVKDIFGNDAVDLLESFTMLSDEGKDRLCQYASDMTKIYTDA